MKITRLFATIAVACITILFSVSASFAESQTMCAGQIPAGWIVVNDAWNPTTCGKPAGIMSNVVTIERYDNKPAGSQMRACSGTVPRGWVIVSTAWSPGTCGRPASISNNVMTIKKLN